MYTSCMYTSCKKEKFNQLDNNIFCVDQVHRFWERNVIWFSSILKITSPIRIFQVEEGLEKKRDVRWRSHDVDDTIN